MPCEECGCEDSNPAVLVCPCCGEVEVKNLCDACVEKIEMQSRINVLEEAA